MLRKHLEQIYKGQGENKASQLLYQKRLWINLLLERKGLETSSITASLTQIILQQMPCSQKKNRLTMIHTFTTKFITMTIHSCHACCLLMRKRARGARTTFVTGRKWHQWIWCFRTRNGTSFLCMEIGKTNKLQTRSQRVTTTLTRSVSCDVPLLY